jgi:hypothetical protein
MSETAESKGPATDAPGQLRLLGSDARPRRREWVLDERTRQLGRAGIAAARETLAKAHPPDPVRKAS